MGVEKRPRCSANTVKDPANPNLEGPPPIVSFPRFFGNTVHGTPYLASNNTIAKFSRMCKERACQRRSMQIQ